MATYSAIDTITAYEDGDVIIPSMGVDLTAGHILAQYWNPATDSVTTSSDFTLPDNQPTLYPQPYSSKEAKYVVPDKTGQQWYINSLGADTAGILKADGTVKDAYKSLFAATTFTVNGNTYPALKVIGNLATADDLNSKTIYYQSTYKTKTFVCKQEIPVYETVGDTYDVSISSVNEKGVSDTVIDNDSEFLNLRSYLTMSGAESEPDAAKWQKLTTNGWKDLSTQSGLFQVSDNGRNLKVMDAGLSGIEDFRAVLTKGGRYYSSTIQLADTHDPYYISIGRSTVSGIIQPDQDVSYTPKVYQRSNNEVQSGWSFSFTTFDNDGVQIRKASAVNTFTVTSSEISQHKTITVAISAEK